MSDQEVCWDAEKRDNALGKDDVEEEDVKADEEGDVSEEAGPLSQTEQADDQTSSTPDSSTECKNRPKKAQRTHRIQLSAPQTSSNQEAGGSEGNQSAPAATSSTLRNALPPGNRQIPAALSPIQIPPQIIAFQNEDDCVCGDSLDKEPSAVLTGLCCVVGRALKLFCGLWRFVRGLLKSLASLVFTPAVLGTVLYCATVYLAVMFLTDQDNQIPTAEFDVSLKYVLHNAIWLVLTIFAPFLVIHFKTSSLHHQFLYESLVDSTLMFINSLVIASHSASQYLFWLGPVFVVAAIFRFLYWISLFYLQTKWQQLFRTPTILNCIILSVYNLGLSLHGYTGWLLDTISGSDSSTGESVTEDPGLATSGQEHQGVFKSPSMCDLAEKLFCGSNNVQ